MNAEMLLKMFQELSSKTTSSKRDGSGDEDEETLAKKREGSRLLNEMGRASHRKRPSRISADVRVAELRTVARDARRIDPPNWGISKSRRLTTYVELDEYVEACEKMLSTETPGEVVTVLNRYAARHHASSNFRHLKAGYKTLCLVAQNRLWRYYAPQWNSATVTDSKASSIVVETDRDSRVGRDEREGYVEMKVDD